MINTEEAKKIKSETRSVIRKNVTKWKTENPDWASSESMTYLENKVSPNTFTSYKSILPLFCHWEKTTPDQMITLRETQYRSEERKERYYFEDRLIEFQQFLVEGHYKPKSIKTILSRVSGFFTNHRLDLMERCLNWFEKYLKGLPEAKNVGEIVFSGDWGMKVTEVNKIDSHSDKKEVTIEVKLNFTGENTKKIEIDIESDIYIVLEGGDEISPEGLMAKIQDKDVVIAGGKYSISQIYDESKGNIIPLTLRFKVPEDMKKAKLKVKDFPFIFINL